MDDRAVLAGIDVSKSGLKSHGRLRASQPAACGSGYKTLRHFLSAFPSVATPPAIMIMA